MKTTTLKQVVKIIDLFKDTPSEQVQALLESGLLADLRDGNIAGVNRDEFRRTIGLDSLDRLTFPVTVNYDLSFQDVIGGKRFGCVRKSIAEKFSTKEKGMNATKIILVPAEFNSIKLKDVLDMLERNNLRPATAFELITFGAKYAPDKFSSDFLIVALGSSCGFSYIDWSYIISLTRWTRCQWQLDLVGSLAFELIPNDRRRWRFAAVRK